jgi:hypothetical protein
MNKIKKLGAFVLVFGTVTWADCLDRVKQVWINPNGFVQFRTEKKCPSATCGLNASSGWTVETSKQALAALLTAQTAGTDVYLIFNESTSTNCTPQSGWQYPVKEFRVGPE